MAIKDFEEIKKEIIKEFGKLLKKEQIIHGIKAHDAYGHSAGTPMEEWVKTKLKEAGWEVYYPNEFLTKIFEKIGKNQKKIEKYRNNIWWGKLLIIKTQIKDFIDGKHLHRWQQEGADLVLIRRDFFKDAEKIMLLNVKSHNIGRASRDPNIMSGQRLLIFLHELIQKEEVEELLKNINLFFIGVDYKVSGDNGIIEGVQVKDLYKLDTSKIPQINFDAAIQIQWHVKDMVEIEQTKAQFIKRLAKTFKNRWDKHSKHKSEKYEKLVEDIQTILKDD